MMNINKWIASVFPVPNGRDSRGKRANAMKYIPYIRFHVACYREDQQCNAEGISLLKHQKGTERLYMNMVLQKHNVTETGVRQAFLDKPRYRFIERGRYEGEHLYLALGVTDSGRYLAVYFIHKKNKKALIITARDMTETERKKYAKK